MITSIASVYYGIGDDQNAGLIKTGGNLASPSYALSANDDGFGFIHVPAATSSECGTIKLNYSPSGSHLNGNAEASYVSCGLEATAGYNGVTFIPKATNGKFGVIMLDQDKVISSSTYDG